MLVLILRCEMGGAQDPERDNMVAPPQPPESVRQSAPAQVEEPNNDKPVSLDQLLQEAARHAHPTVEDKEDRSCTPGTFLSELDQCLTREQLQHYLPLTLSKPHVTAKSPTRKVQRQKRQISALIFTLWEGAVVPYIFNASFTTQDRQFILSAMAEWEKVTCIRFRPATADDKDLLVIRDGRRCSTNIGRLGGRQYMTLAQPCRRKRILVHELGHVLGLIHEHQRHDRDGYVSVLLRNVRSSRQERYQFSKLAPSPWTDGLVPYSYTSIMHYGKNYFAKTPDLITLQTADPKFQNIIGRALRPAHTDVEAVKIMYGCSATNQNRLPDGTCELFKRTGECDGRNRDAVRSLCRRTCHLHHQGHRDPAVVSYPAVSQASFSRSALQKAHVPQLSQYLNTISHSSGMRRADTGLPFPVYDQHARPQGFDIYERRVSVFGNAPRRYDTAQYARQQQQQQRNYHQQQGQHLPGPSKWTPSVDKSRSNTQPALDNSGTRSSQFTRSSAVGNSNNYNNDFTNNNNYLYNNFNSNNNYLNNNNNLNNNLNNNNHLASWLFAQSSPPHASLNNGGKLATNARLKETTASHTPIGPHRSSGVSASSWMGPGSGSQSWIRPRVRSDLAAQSSRGMPVIAAQGSQGVPGMAAQASQGEMTAPEMAAQGSQGLTRMPSPDMVGLQGIRDTAVHNMKALSPETLPETVARLSSANYPQLAVHQDTYYQRPTSNLGALNYLYLLTQRNPSLPSGYHTRRPVLPPRRLYDLSGLGRSDPVRTWSGLSRPSNHRGMPQASHNVPVHSPEGWTYRGDLQRTGNAGVSNTGVAFRSPLQGFFMA